MSSTRVPCPFCTLDRRELLFASGHAFGISDAFPVARGHTLIVPRRHVLSLFDLADEEYVDVWNLVKRVRETLSSRWSIDGFTVGVNDGEAAGRTVSHAHVHVIPRYRGDVTDPRGGIRWVLPSRARYWSE